MKGKRIIIFDIEGNGLLRTITKIHCVCWQEPSSGLSGSITDYQEMRNFFLQPNVIFVGHNIVTFDIPVVEKLLGINIVCDKFDTLAVSWIKETHRQKHGLESYGEEFDIPKPIIDQWDGEGPEFMASMIHRCSEDVKINTKLWDRQLRWLYVLYEYDEDQIYRFMKYLQFKLECVAEQEQVGIRLDVERASAMAEKLRALEKEKIDEIEKAMPMVEIKKKKAYKNAVTDNSGFVSEKGDLFFESIIEKNDGIKFVDVVEKVIGYKDPNAGSHIQIKNWLYSLGWVPQHIKFVRNKETGETKEIPQIGSKEKDGTLCPSIVVLFEKEPKLKLLEGLSIIIHRLAIFEGFLRDNIDGRLYPSAKGLTNTMRLKHSVVVNLPDLSKAYGEDIRGCLIADDGSTLVGTDLSGVEDNTKRHYIYPFDPEYVEEMNTPGYDAHLDIAMRAGMLTLDQCEEHKLYERTEKKEGKSHGAVRKKAKVVNFSATYGIGKAALARNSGMKEEEAEKLLTTYWERNKGVLLFVKTCKIKNIAGQDWVFNPVSKFWYSLRSEKDVLSTVNQSTAVYVFDTWVGFCRKLGMKLALQMHDEHLSNTPIGTEEEVKEKITKAIKQMNDRLKLNVTIGCSIQTGATYSTVH